MKESIPFYVLRYLDLLPELHIPGLGHFYWEQHPAQIDFSTRTISPPSRTSSFAFDEKAGADRFVKFLSYQTGKPEKVCAQVTRSFVNDLLLRLKEEGEVNIPELGVFREDTPAGIRFSADPQAENARFLGFRPVPMSFLSATDAEKSDQDPGSGSKEMPGSRKVEDTEIVPAIPVQPETDDSIVHETGKLFEEDGRNREIASANTSGPQETERTGDEISSPEDGRVPSAWPWYYSSIILLLMIMALLFIYDQPPEYLSTQQEVAEENEIMNRDRPVMEGRIDSQPGSGAQSEGTPTDEIQAGLEQGRSAELDPEAEAPEDSAGSKPVSEGSISPGPFERADCMIVVGAFREQANVARMSARLESMGYRPHRRKTGSLTMVGVKRPCRTAALRSVLYEVRNEIDGGSWVLRISGVPPGNN